MRLFTIAFFSFLMLPGFIYCQDLNASDSALATKRIQALLDSLRPDKSYLMISLGVGNNLLSVHNNKLNASLATNKVIVTPELSYYHKSGFGLSFKGYLLSDSGKSKFYQSSLTPFYDYLTGKTVEAGISYTRTFVKDKFNNSTSPIQNDIYGYAYLKNPWLKPGLAIGYASGKYNDITHVDTMLKVGNTNQYLHYNFIDTASTKLTSFTLVAMVQHVFKSQDVFANGDNFSFIPQLMANFGMDKSTVKHNAAAAGNSAIIKKKNRLRTSSKNQNSSFALESLGMDMQATYSTGKFDFTPMVYLDYFLPATTDKKFTQVYSFIVSYSF